MSSDIADNASGQSAGPTEPVTSSPAPTPVPAGVPEGEWVDLCPLAEVPEQAGKYVGSKTHSLAIFRVDNQTVQVMDDTCPHAGASLAAGYVADGKVFCPWHGWPFNLADGVCPDNDCIKMKTYPNRVVNGMLQAKL